MGRLADELLAGGGDGDAAVLWVDERFVPLFRLLNKEYFNLELIESMYAARKEGREQAREPAEDCGIRRSSERRARGEGSTGGRARRCNGRQK